MPLLRPLIRSSSLAAALLLVAAACGGSEEGAQAGDLVAVHYTGTLDDGEKFDSSLDRGQPLEFTVGAGQMITGFDAAVVGMAVGDTKTVRLAPTEAYGDKLDEQIVDVPLTNLPEDVEVGQQLFSPNGQTVVVVAINEDSATIDANHPLAGEFLTFEIEMVSIGP